MVVATIPVGDAPIGVAVAPDARSEEHTSELQSRSDLVCRLLLEKKKRHCELSDWAGVERSVLRCRRIGVLVIAWESVRIRVLWFVSVPLLACTDRRRNYSALHK